MIRVSKRVGEDGDDNKKKRKRKGSNDYSLSDSGAEGGEDEGKEEHLKTRQYE